MKAVLTRSAFTRSAWCPPSSSITRPRSTQQKSVMNGPIACCRRNFAPRSCRARKLAQSLTSSELLRVWIREHEIRPHPFPEGNKRMLNNRKLLAGQFKDRELDSRVVGLLKRHLHLVAELDIVDSLSHQTAFHDHAFIQDDIDVADRHIFFERRIARHAHPGEGVNFAGPFGLDPIDIAAEAIDTNDPGKELELAAGFALLQQKLADGGAFPVRLVNFIDLG